MPSLCLLFVHSQKYVLGLIRYRHNITLQNDTKMEATQHNNILQI